MLSVTSEHGGSVSWNTRSSGPRSDGSLQNSHLHRDSDCEGFNVTSESGPERRGVLTLVCF